MIASESYTFRGDHTTYGGWSKSEEGGAGTVFVRANCTTSHLHVKNRGVPPYSTSQTDPQHDSARTFIASDDNSLLSFDHLTIGGAAHLTTADGAEMAFGHLHGDKTGFLHVASHVTVMQADSPFPTLFRVYRAGRLSLPKSMYLIIIM